MESNCNGHIHSWQTYMYMIDYKPMYAACETWMLRGDNIFVHPAQPQLSAIGFYEMARYCARYSARYSN